MLVTNPPAPRDPDVCVVGAGPAGLVTALTLGDAGRRVAVLESGGGAGEADAQALNEGDSDGEPYVGLAGSRHRAVGGTVHIWNVRVGGRSGAKYVPLSPRDLRNWPITWRELESFYDEAQAVCGLGPFEYGSDRWASERRRPFDLDGTALRSGVYQFGFGAVFTTDLPRRLAALPNVSLLPSTTVVGVGCGQGRPTVAAVGGDDRPLRITPKVVVLACGAIENARLLLGSGLGASLPWLGRGFMEHARDFSLSIDPFDPDVYAAASFYDLHESGDGHLVGGRLALTDEALDAEELPNASMTLFPRVRIDPSLPARLGRVFRRSRARRSGPYGWSERGLDGSAFADFKLVLNMEQRPDPANRVVLSARVDRFGNRLPRLVLGWKAEEQAALERLRGVTAEALRSAGVGRLVYRPGHRPDLSAHHHAGTTRMAADPADGVVDREGRLFGYDRVYLAGASVFPGAGFANPTLSIVAMAMRLGRHLDATLD